MDSIDYEKWTWYNMATKYLDYWATLKTRGPINK
jgi:hypothetical protein